jgi:cellulose biosynthesis protein BcsQ
LLALVSFEREAGRTTIARGLISAFARRGLRAVRAHAPPPEFPSRCDVLVVDEPGPPSTQLLAEADAVLVVVRPALEAVRAAEAKLGQIRAYRRAPPRYLASRVDARTDVPALAAMRALLGPRLLSTTIHEDPFLDDPGSQVQADFLSLARELRRRRR